MAEKLPFEDAAFDRLIACHVLEHLYKPHEALREWNRVVRPGGIISIVLPCDPGLMYRLGRFFGPPRRHAKRCGYDPEYIDALEHVNPIHNLIALIRYYFVEKTEIWWPLYMPSLNMNLMAAINVTRQP
jgi:SAM-dependent methyltransferase